ITLQVQRRGSQHIEMVFSPAFSLRAKVVTAEINGRRSELRAEAENGVDQHVAVSVPIDADSTTVRIRFRNDFGITYRYAAPAIGAVSSDIKFVSQQWSAAHDRLELRVAGVNGAKYQVQLYGDLTGMTVSGGSVQRSATHTILEIEFPAGPA